METLKPPSFFRRFLEVRDSGIRKKKVDTPCRLESDNYSHDHVLSQVHKYASFIQSYAPWTVRAPGLFDSRFGAGVKPLCRNIPGLVPIYGGAPKAGQELLTHSPRDRMRCRREWRELGWALSFMFGYYGHVRRK